MSIKETWEHIASHWDEELFKMAKRDWTHVQSHIVLEGGIKCINCSTQWINNDYISSNNMCSNCDNRCQPFLCNPINKKLVIKYIPAKYHHYIFDLRTAPSLREIYSEYFRTNIWKNIKPLKWVIPKLYVEILNKRKIWFFNRHSNPGYYPIENCGEWRSRNCYYIKKNGGLPEMVPLLIKQPRKNIYTRNHQKEIFTVRRVDNNIYLWLLIDDSTQRPNVTIYSKWVRWDCHNIYYDNNYGNLDYFNTHNRRQNRYLLDALLDYKLIDPPTRHVEASW